MERCCNAQTIEFDEFIINRRVIVESLGKEVFTQQYYCLCMLKSPQDCGITDEVSRCKVQFATEGIVSHHMSLSLTLLYSLALKYISSQSIIRCTLNTESS